MFSAPGNLTDFQTDAQRQHWSGEIARQFKDVIESIKLCSGDKPQFVSPADRDVSAFVKAPVKWPGFPNSILTNTPKDKAYELLDSNLKRARNVMDEYLEWFVHFDDAQEIVAVDFTTETQKYWEELYKIDKALAAKTYGDILGIPVSAGDISLAGKYDPHNKLNVTDGIVHLVQPNNTLEAELYIAANATIWRTDKTGSATTDVVNCKNCGSSSPLGGTDRNSDPLIASSINALARDGRALSIPDPVGLYIDSLNTQGWATPDASDPRACWKIIRGNPAVRARFEVPNRAFKISQITIGGEPIKHAAQIAEHVMVTLTACMGEPSEFKDVPSVPCASPHPAARAAKPTRHFKSRM